MTYREKYKNYYFRFLKEVNGTWNLKGYKGIPTTWWSDGVLPSRWLQFFAYVGVEDIKLFFNKYNVKLTKKDRYTLRKGIKNGSMYSALTCMQKKYEIFGSEQDFYNAYLRWLDCEII